MRKLLDVTIDPEENLLAQTYIGCQTCWNEFTNRYETDQYPQSSLLSYTEQNIFALL